MSKNKNRKEFKEVIEDFFYSDTVPATATKFLLMFLAMGGLVFVGALLPGLFSATKQFKSDRRYTKKEMRNAVYNLKKRKLIKVIRDNDGKITVELTNQGKKRIKEFVFETLTIKKPRKWDKKWRVLIFDIPIKPAIYNKAREALRLKIKELGFHQLQKSVWIYPYECDDEVLLLAEIYQVSRFIEILTVEKLLHEDQIRKSFKL
ncbi:hypothetical protein BMS3Abin15_00421 [bacterium BMS3Abin15]|nr:hypothetical protein BMS3Abin15_00421 [bacterium BMS3Abin15]